MKSKSIVVIVTVFVLASMMLSACASATPVATEAPTAAATTAAATVAATAAPTTAASNPDTIIIGTTDKIASLDPADAYAVHDWEVIKNISNGLLAWKPGTTDIEADLATDLGTVSADGLTYTFTLKDGIKFGDGTPLTATIYAAQLNRLLTIGPKCPNDVADSLAVPFVKSITAPDDKTIVFVLTTPIAYFRNLLATAPFVAADPNIFKADACTLFPTAPIYGTGPWFVSQFNADEQMVLEPNPNYTGKYKPQVKQIIIRFYSDANTLALAVQSGEIDIAWRMLSTDQITQLTGVKGVKIGTISGGSIRFLTINRTMKPTDDPNVVKAIASSIDRNEIADTVFGGKVTPLFSMVPPGFLGATDAFDKMYASPDLAAAKKFLEASGYSATKPVKLTIYYPPEHYGATTAAWMQIIKKQLEATGEIQVTLQAQEWSTYIPALTGGKSYNVGVMGWFFDYPDPSNYLDPFIYNGGMGNNITAAVKGSTTGKPINDTAKQLVALLQKADIEQDNTKRVDEYAKAQDLYADLAGNIPLFFEAEHVVYRDNISGSASYATPDTLNIGSNIVFNYSLLSKSK
jgi:peptide/nickel transport system substrate-binding protein